jgi:hypothetical protein
MLIPESVNRRRTDNTMVKKVGRNQKGVTRIRKSKDRQHNCQKSWKKPKGVIRIRKSKKDKKIGRNVLRFTDSDYPFLVSSNFFDHCVVCPVIRNRKSKDRKHNCQKKKKRTNNNLQNINKTLTIEPHEPH